MRWVLCVWCVGAVVLLVVLLRDFRGVWRVWTTLCLMLLLACSWPVLLWVWLAGV